jgi:hypothetical protein
VDSLGLAFFEPIILAGFSEADRATIIELSIREFLPWTVSEISWGDALTNIKWSNHKSAKIEVYLWIQIATVSKAIRRLGIDDSFP